MQYKTYYKSPLGRIILISDGENLTTLKLEYDRFYNLLLEEKIQQKDNLKIFNKTKKWLDRYFIGEKPQISEISLLPRGSTFRQEVWKILCDIPYGTVTTYLNIANKITKKTGKNMGGQPIGGAVGHNPISIIIPCHRVVGVDGNLTGYSAGIDNKIKLLKLEKVDMTRLYQKKI